VPARQPHRNTRAKSVIGGRIFLRPPEKNDFKEFTTLNRASLSLHRGLASPPRTRAQYEAFLQRSRQLNAACFLICRLTDGAIVGSINLSEIVRGGFQSAYLGYFVGQSFARQGYMTEALRLMLKYAFTRLKLHRLEANIQPSNIPSITLVKRAGFVHEGFSRDYLKISGQWRDHERWAITIDLWKARKQS
jgi:[ribosomal protein S5]-alanine N-acetyltransferase